MQRKKELEKEKVRFIIIIFDIKKELNYNIIKTRAVSYTHLDVYKRQAL